MKTKIKGFNPTTLIDWPGRVASIIFLGGCNFRCPYCHSPDLVLNPQDLSDIPVDEVKSYLKEKKGWIKGLVITGGEPTLYREIEDFIADFKKTDIPLKLDTNGSRPEVLKKLLKKNLIDYIALDIKAPLEPTQNKNAVYDLITGVKTDISKIKRSIELIRKSNIDYEFRTTIAPGQLELEDIKKIASFITGARRYILQQFVPNNTLSPEMKEIKSLPIEELEKMAESARTYVAEVSIRGR
ncbi:MAG: anaerobic ribonucleoside-triphosphate reductase activating protein [Candidatus Omnitrophica bacterium]|nr:anaerobic ribonucleoside-triphosphate reductase activating protein [Candidatus Omnitrophota bacterium]